MSRDEDNPGPLDVKAEARRQRKILARFRAFKGEVLRRVGAGTWPPPPPDVKSRKPGRGQPIGLPTRRGSTSRA